MPWCSIGVERRRYRRDRHARRRREARRQEHVRRDHPDRPVRHAIGGYPGCKPPISAATGRLDFDRSSRRPAHMGVGAYLTRHWFDLGGRGWQGHQRSRLPDEPLVVRADGRPVHGRLRAERCPRHSSAAPSHAPNPAAVDSSGRLKAVYPIPVHSAWCPRYQYYKIGQYALTPGAPGCLQKLGCKGIATKSQCGVHGWNNQQPENGASLSITISTAGTAATAPSPGIPAWPAPRRAIRTASFPL